MLSIHKEKATNQSVVKVIVGLRSFLQKHQRDGWGFEEKEKNLNLNLGNQLGGKLEKNFLGSAI